LLPKLLARPPTCMDVPALTLQSCWPAMLRRRAVAALKALEIRTRATFQDLLAKRGIKVDAMKLPLELSMQQMVGSCNVDR